MNERYLINFDLDNTLADLAKPIYPQALKMIKTLIAKGHILTINSGKPVYYLVGLCRQADLQNIWLIGENGADICYGVTLPLKKPFAPLTKKASIILLQDIKQEIKQIFGGRIWFEPNVVALSPFFDSAKTQVELKKFLENKSPDLEKYRIHVYPHEDCFDLIPDGIDKSTGIKLLAKHYSVERHKMIAIGDTWNDIPMFESCGHSIVIDFPDIPLKLNKWQDVYHVANIDEALSRLGKIIRK